MRTDEPKRSWFRWWMVPLAFLALTLIAVPIVRALLNWRLESELERLRVKGWPTTAGELEDFYPAPPPGENIAGEALAATALLKDPAEAITADLPVRGTATLPEPNAPLPGPMRAALEQDLAANAAALEALHALEPGPCRYDLDFRDHYYTELPHLAQLHKGARLLMEDAIHAATAGDDARAAAAMEQMLLLGNTLSGEPVLVSQMPRVTIHTMALETLEQVLARADLTDAQLARLQAAYANARAPGALRRGLLGEFVCFQDGIDKALDTWFPRFTGSTAGSFEAEALAFAYRATGLLACERLEHLRIMEDFVRQFASPPYPPEKEVDPYMKRIPPWCILTRLPTPHLGRTGHIFNLLLAKRRLAVATLAAMRYEREHGAWPGTLGDLVPQYLDHVPQDPFAQDQPLRYATGNGLARIYSIGVNRTDEGGDDTDDPAHPRRQLDILMRLE